MASRTIATYSIAVAPATAIFLAGYGFALGHTSVPQLYDVRPQISTPAFDAIFHEGASVAVPLSIISTAASGYLAYFAKSSRIQRLYLIAAAGTFLPLMYTRLVMIPGIKRLIEISKNTAIQDKSEQTLEHRQLLIRWVKQNYARVVLYAAGGWFGLQAAAFG